MFKVLSVLCGNYISLVSLGLFFIKQIWLALFFEFFYVALPAGTYFISTLACLYHLADVGATGEFVKKRCEELDADFKVVIGINNVLEVHAPGYHVLGFEVVKVDTVAQLIHLWWSLGTRTTSGLEREAVAFHVGMAIHLKRPVGATP